MFGFGKDKSNKEQMERQVQEAKLHLRQLSGISKTNLQKEIAQAQGLRERGMRSPSNDARIGIYYFMHQIVQMVYTRVNDIESSVQLKETMDGLTHVIGSVAELGKQGKSVDFRSLFQQLRQLQEGVAGEQEGLLGALGGLSGAMKQTGSAKNSSMPESDLIERLIAGEDLTQLPVDAVPVEQPVRTQPRQKEQSAGGETFDMQKSLKEISELIDSL